MPIKTGKPRIQESISKTTAKRIMGSGMAFFGETLRSLRELAGLTQEELAKKTGLTVFSIRNWEQKIRTPRYDAIIALAKVLGVSAEVFGEKPAREGKSKPGRPKK